LILFFF